MARPSKLSLIKAEIMRNAWANKTKKEQQAWCDAISKGQKRRYRRERREAAKAA